MLKFLHIICYKWGTSFTSKEVNILHAMVKRNLSVPFKFYCITDDPKGLDDGVIAAELPSDNLPGNGPKIYTFSSDILGLGSDDHVVCLDIDLVIVGNLDFLATSPNADFIIAPHRVYKGNNRVHGAVYRVRVGALSRVWDIFIKNPMKYAKQHPGHLGNTFSEQSWLEVQLNPEDYNFFPDTKVIWFRADCKAKARGAKKIHAFFKMFGINFTTAKYGTAKLPNIGESIVSFAGPINPKDVIDNHTTRFRRAPFVKELWRI